MSLLDNIKKDVRKIVSNANEFAKPIKMTAPNGPTITINGLTTDHHFGVDSEGNTTDSHSAHCSFMELDATDQSYPIRNTAGQVDLAGHIFEFTDHAGVSHKYQPKSWHPNNKLGKILVMLLDYE